MLESVYLKSQEKTFLPSKFKKSGTVCEDLFCSPQISAVNRAAERSKTIVSELRRTGRGRSFGRSAATRAPWSPSPLVEERKEGNSVGNLELGD